MTSGQEMERVYSYNPGARMGLGLTWKTPSRNDLYCVEWDVKLYYTTILTWSDLEKWDGKQQNK